MPTCHLSLLAGVTVDDVDRERPEAKTIVTYLVDLMLVTSVLKLVASQFTLMLLSRAQALLSTWSSLQ